MITRKERRLRSLEKQLGLGPKLELPLIFEHVCMYKDEPDELVISANMGNTVWERKTEESVKEFIERIKQDVKRNPVDNLGAIALKKDYSGLPKPSVSTPAYTPYSEVIKNLQKVEQQSV